MNKKQKAEVNAFYEMYKKEKGEKMFYNFKCTKCGKAQEVEIAIKDYDKEKDKQKCSCGGKLERVIEWNGIATAEGQGLVRSKGRKYNMTENEFLLADRIQKIKSMNELYDLENNAYISFSGGKDSTVLHYLFDLALPGNKIPRLFINTNIEYIYIYQFVKRLSEHDDRIIILNSNINIKDMLNEVGYPFKSKRHSEKVYEYKLGYRNKSILQYFKIIEGGYKPCPNKLLYQIKDDFNLKISHKCCLELKKKPAIKWSKENQKPIKITGMLREEGGQRENINCILLDKDNNLKAFHPMSPLSKQWEDWFINEYKIKLCELYYPPYNFKRTGCKGCPFTLDLQDQLYTMACYLPEERKQCEIIWGKVYDEYRRINYRLESSLF